MRRDRNSHVLPLETGRRVRRFRIPTLDLAPVPALYTVAGTQVVKIAGNRLFSIAEH